MINIISFFFFNLSNITFAILIPNELSKLFFLNFSLSSGVFTFLVFYNFSKKEFISYKVTYLISLILITIFHLIENLNFLIWFYTFLILYSDYFFSQKQNKINNLIFKILLFVSSLLLFQNILSLGAVIKIKILIVILFLILFEFTKYKETIKLKVNSPVKYTIWTCLIYFGSLFIISILMSSEILKYAYISLQIFIGLQLKIFDMKIRNIYLKNKKFEYLLFFLGIIYFITFSIYFSDYKILIIFILSLMGLNYAKNKFIV